MERRKMSPSQRLEMALNCIQNPTARLQLRRIFEKEFSNASIFWDVEEKQIEFVNDDLEIIIRERIET